MAGMITESPSVSSLIFWEESHPSKQHLPSRNTNLSRFSYGQLTSFSRSIPTVVKVYGMESPLMKLRVWEGWGAFLHFSLCP